MKTTTRMIMTLLILMLTAAISVSSTEARGSRHGGYQGHSPRVGIGFWIGPGWWPYYYPSYYYPYYQPEPPIVVHSQPEVYEVPAPSEDQPVYWYYCKDPQGYYPYVKQCPSGWMRVVPTPPAPDDEPKE